jgi:tetrahydromethanopterin S-methyltransferase subunit B
MNRGLITGPFSNGIIVSPVTTDESLERLQTGFADVAASLSPEGTELGRNSNR